jgi:hypothetical protein
MDNDSVRIKVLELSSENTILKYSNKAALQELADAYESYIINMFYGGDNKQESLETIQKIKAKHDIK